MTNSSTDDHERADLQTLVRDPARIASVPIGQIPALLTQLSAVQSSMAVRLVAAAADDTDKAEDTLLDVDEAAERLGVSTDWLYRRTKKLPFVVRLGRHVRYSTEGIDRFIRNRVGR